MSGKSVRVGVVWDTDDQGDCELPDIVFVPGHVVDADEEGGGTIADWLSDEFGFCVHGLSFPDDDGESAETQTIEHHERWQRLPSQCEQEGRQ